MVWSSKALFLKMRGRAFFVMHTKLRSLCSRKMDLEIVIVPISRLFKKDVKTEL